MEARSIIFSILILKACVPQVEAEAQKLISALYVFGDSTTDPGNNNGLLTLVKANFPPYGRDFPNGRPTGRFTNGRLVTDILSGLAGLPDLLPANLDPNFQGEKLLTGASFGSSASGIDDSTSLSFNVIPLGKQVQNFRDYRVKLADMIGEVNASKIVSEALFAISAGTDDFANNYYLDNVTKKKYSVQQFQDLLIGHLHEFVQSVYNEGATQIAIIGLPPFGCLPSQITLHNLMGNTCVEEYNKVARSFNQKIVALVEDVESSAPGLLIIYLDIYNKLYDMVKNPFKYGFEEARKGCCGTGLLETSITCNEFSPTCAETSKYIFWDAFHPTTAAYNILANDLFQQAIKYKRT